MRPAVTRQEIVSVLTMVEDEIRQEGQDVAEYVAGEVARIIEEMRHVPESRIWDHLGTYFADEPLDSIEARARRACGTVMGIIAVTFDDIDRNLENLHAG